MTADLIIAPLLICGTIIGYHLITRAADASTHRIKATITAVVGTAVSYCTLETIGVAIAMIDAQWERPAARDWHTHNGPQSQ